MADEAIAAFVATRAAKRIGARIRLEKVKTAAVARTTTQRFQRHTESENRRWTCPLLLTARPVIPDTLLVSQDRLEVQDATGKRLVTVGGPPRHTTPTELSFAESRQPRTLTQADLLV